MTQEAMGLADNSIRGHRSLECGGNVWFNSEHALLGGKFPQKGDVIFNARKPQVRTVCKVSLLRVDEPILF